MWQEFEWDDANILHIARHNVSPEEVESALRGYTLEIDYEIVGGEERFTEIGVTIEDRYLEITSTLRDDSVRVITAYEAPRAGIAEYLRKGEAMENRIIPVFANEAEEAEWWYEHREEITQDLIEAVRAGRNGIGTRGRLQAIRERRAKEEVERGSVPVSDEQVLASAK